MRPVLFDLDGTLVDTAHDLGFALNSLREQHGLPALPYDTIRPVASHGSKGLLKLGFDVSEEDPEFSDLVQSYLSLYESVIDRKPIFLPGIESLLTSLEQFSTPWGIVTNKPRRFSEPLINAIPFLNGVLSGYAGCLVCGDDVPSPKPSPESLFMACDKLGVLAKDVTYVGDAARDVEAGNAANMQTIVALFGYLSESDRPEEWGANYLVSSADEILPLLD